MNGDRKHPVFKTEESLWKDEGLRSVDDWSADGRFLIVTRRDPTTAQDLWLLPLAGDRKPVALLQTPSDKIGGRFAPVRGGGAPRWVAYASNEGGRLEVYVMSMPGGSPGKWQISSGGGSNPVWRRDGKELYYVASDGQTIMAVDVDSGPAFRAGTPHRLFTIEGLIYFNAWDASPDGARFLAATLVEDGSTSPIHVVTNWQAALKK